MRKSARYIFSLALSLLLTLPALAEQVRLKSGEIISGSIVFQNEQVLVIKKADGSRFQYLRTEVEEVLSDDQAIEQPEEEKAPQKQKKATASLQVAGGMTAIPGNAAGSEHKAGAAAQADLIVGTADLLHKHILLGGGIGYHLHYAGGRAYSFLPIQLRAEAPLSEGKHAPMLGLGIGYGIGLQKGVRGGAFADLAFGWRCRISDSRAISLTLFSNFQQAQIQNYTDVLDGNAFVAPQAGRAFVDFGIRFAAYL